MQLIHLEQVPGKEQRCFSVVDCGVKIHYLVSGELLADLEDLHISTITRSVSIVCPYPYHMYVRGLFCFVVFTTFDLCGTC